MLPVLPDCRPVCGEPVRSGAGKGCYVQCDRVARVADSDMKKASQWEAFFTVNDQISDRCVFVVM
ncbi:hypothetical protein BME68_28390 [Klebsiella pneumoniae]|nr:hypothetical protein BME68_28390 [Klebsiella pneumoniae]OVV55313.1 hypothetical protein BME67_29355 [Klebsiella pneumoniae]OVV59968.1 hypothetical protein BME66_28495 [Klebsiella pneumoniae]OVV72632.1 hypothetical protein BME64_29305 [Klebsiella pneumoniae]PLJ42296.1 hypothetical protein B6J67_10300 [Klebsiella quasipneumoniae]